MESSETSKIYKNKVHKILAHSYFVHFVFLFVGVCLDLIFNLKIFNDSVAVPFGTLFLILGTLLIFWAQKTSRNFKKEDITKSSFLKGPYRYTRTPTNLGLFILVFGFGLVTNAFFVVLLTSISYLFVKHVLLNKQEKILAEKYGEVYLEYKKMVKF